MFFAFFAVSYGSINYAVIFYSVQVETITQSKDHFREINKRGVRDAPLRAASITAEHAFQISA